MLPSKISELIISLKNKTETGDLVWNYDDDDSIVDINLEHFQISIQYSFNTIEEVGQFRIIYLDKESNKEYYFSTNQTYNDYEIVRKLFDNAQASSLNIRFGTL